MHTRLIQITLSIVTVLAVAFIAAVLWWRLWMYRGWAGSPEILHRFIYGVIDGEKAYDFTFYEMYGISLTIATGAMIALHFKLRRQKK